MSNHELDLTPRLPLQLSISPMPADETELNGLLREVHSDQKQAEKRLREQAALIDLAHDAIIVRGLDSRILFWSRGAMDLYGWSGEEALGKVTHELLQAEYPDSLEVIEASIQTNREWEGEIEHTSRDGEVIVVASRWSLLRDELGSPISILEINRDITARKRAEEELKTAALYTRSLIESSLDPLVTISREGKISDANQATERITGVSRESLIGSDFASYFTVPESARKGYEQVFEQGAVRDYPLAIRSRTGKVTDVLYNATVFKNEAGEVAGVFAAARDFTERKRAERALRALSACNESLVRATDEASLLKLICDLIVKVGGYRMAWVGFAEHDDKQTVRPVAESGVEAGYLDTAKITWADQERGRGPTGTAIRTGKATVCHDVTSDPRFAPWRENALSRGYRSALVLPLKNDDEVLGAISIYATEAGAFDDAEQHLLGELADNLSYGISALRARVERKRAQEDIRNLNRELELRVQQRTAELQESEHRVRRKLESILSPDSDLRSLELADLLDTSAVQALADDVYRLTQIPMFILDLKGKVLVSVGWQEICIRFHRAHPEACGNCEESDRELSTGVQPGEFKLYKCKNNLWDVVTPIMLGDRQIGNLFSGQFFFNDEGVDREMFRLQARKYGFDEQEYLAALDRVPRLTRVEAETSMTFYSKLAQLLSQLSYSGIRLARSMSELNHANSALAASVKELESFNYAVAHDLRAPLRHIHGFTELLAEEVGPFLNDSSKHHLDTIQDSVNHMSHLLEDLLSLSRLGRQEIRKRVCGLTSLVGEVVTSLKPEIKEREVEWRIEELPSIECDPALMRQVLFNLLSNALKFTRTRKLAIIEVGQTTVGGESVIFIRDNGVGFSMKYVEKLFGLFQRLHRQQDFEGTGVGLAIVQRIVNRHGGRVWADAEPDKGATFYLSLQFCETENKEPATDAVAVAV